jgi:hypothetical protein
MDTQGHDQMIKIVAGAGGAVIKTILFFPIHLLFTVPYWVACKTGLDKLFGKAADKIKFGDEKSDPVALEAWARDLYKDSENFRVNFNRKAEFKEALFDKTKFGAAHIPVPPNLERGVFHYGKIHNGVTTKDQWFSGLHFNPKLWADAYDKTRGRALMIGFQICVPLSAALIFALSKYVGFNATTHETWGELGISTSFSLWTMLSSYSVSLAVIAACLAPFVLIKKLAKSEHDVMALNETLLYIKMQVAAYGGNEASKEEVSLAGVEGSLAILNSQTLAKQRKDFWRVYTAGEPMIYFNKDDGTARARGSLHGYEAGTPILISLSDLNQNVLATGKIGSGKTTGIGLPIFDRILNSFKKNGYPIQGLGQDGKATIYHRLMKILKMSGMSTDKFVIIGVDEGQYGIPIFHGLSVEKCIEILKSTSKGDGAEDFWVKTAFAHIERVLRIAKAYHQTPMGVQYEIQSGGCTVDSPEWVKRLCNNPEILYSVITELTECLDKNESLRYALYDPSLKSAIDGCLEDWKNMLQTEETAASAIATMNSYLKDFTSNGKILERFGQGRVGENYKELDLCMKGYFFFSALADTEYGDAARAINIFARSRLYNMLTLREMEYRKYDKDPQKEPVIVFIDEHHLVASSGTTGLSDTSILNVSRSMGQVFIGMTQSNEAYETVLGKTQTENMTQQMLTRVILPTKSDATAKWLADNCGTGYRLGTFTDGVFATEGAREMVNGGVIKRPRTEIFELSKFTPVSLPSTIQLVDKKLMDEAAKNTKAFSILGYFRKSFVLGSGIEYINLINSPGHTNKLRYKAKMERYTFSFLGALGEIPEKADQPSEKELETESSGRSDSIERVPLFSNNDLIATGNFRAVISIPQYGVEHWCRTELEPMYI